MLEREREQEKERGINITHQRERQRDWKEIFKAQKEERGTDTKTVRREDSSDSPC